MTSTTPEEPEEEPFKDYESGPFCRHWADPSDCDRKCARCGHLCRTHHESLECEEFLDESAEKRNA